MIHHVDEPAVRLGGWPVDERNWISTFENGDRVTVRWQVKGVSGGRQGERGGGEEDGQRGGDGEGVKG